VGDSEEAVGDTRGGGLEAARGGRKVAGGGESRNVGVCAGVHGDRVACVTAAAAEIGGVDEGGAGGIELRHEGVPAAAAVGCRRRRREVAGVGFTRHEGVAGRVHRNAEACLSAAAAEVGGVNEGAAGGVGLRRGGVA